MKEVFKMDLKKKSYLFYVYYFCIFCGVSLTNSFMSMYMANHGVSEAAVGILNGIVQVLGLLLYPLAGRIADKTRTKNLVLYIELILCLTLAVIFYRSRGLLMMEIMMITFLTVFYGLTVIYETITVDYTSKAGMAYAPIRMCGTIGFSIMAGISGFFLASREELLFPLMIGVLTTVTMLAFLLPKSYNRKQSAEERTEAAKKKESVLFLLKDREVRNVMILFGIYWLTYAYNQSYFGIYSQELGGTYLLVGIANMLTGLSEIPFHIGRGRRWMKKIGTLKALMVSTAVGVFRWTLCALTRNPYVLVFTMVLNGIMLVPTIVDVVEFLYRKAPEHLKTSVASGLKSPFMVGGQLIAHFAGGLSIAYWALKNLNGIRITYWLAALISLIGFVYVFISDRRGRKLS